MAEWVVEVPDNRGAKAVSSDRVKLIGCLFGKLSNDQRFRRNYNAATDVMLGSQLRNLVFLPFAIALNVCSIVTPSLADGVLAFSSPALEAAPNRSTRYLEVQLGRIPAATSTGLVYPKLKTTNDSNWSNLQPGNYIFRLQFRAKSRPDILKVNWRSSDPSTPLVTEAIPLERVFSSKWYTYSIRLNVYQQTQGRLSVSIHKLPSGESNPTILQIDNLSLKGAEDQVEHLNAKVDLEDQDLLNKPELSLMQVSDTFQMVEVRENLNWQVLPSWFEQNRTQIHTRLTPNAFSEDESSKFWASSRELAGIGTKVFTRHVKTGQEGTWLPTSSPSFEEEGQAGFSPNLSREI